MVHTPGLVLHTTPYGDSSVVVRVFTRQLGVRSYIIKGVRTARGRVKQNLLQPLSSVDMVVYCNSRSDLNHVRELVPRRPDRMPDPVGNALRFFAAELLYRTLAVDAPMPDLWDYVDGLELEPATADGASNAGRADLPVRFLLAVAHHLGIEPLDNHAPRLPYFDLQQGSFVAATAETTLSAVQSLLLHAYLDGQEPCPSADERLRLLDALLLYFQLHVSGFSHFTSHEILHTVLR